MAKGRNAMAIWQEVFDLATGASINKREDVLFLGPGGTGKSHLAQAIGQCAIQQGCKVLSRETHILLDELADAVIDGRRKEYVESIATMPLLIIDDFGMRKLPHTAAEDLLEIIMRRYERFSTLLTSIRPAEDRGKLLGDVAAVCAMLEAPNERLHSPLSFVRSTGVCQTRSKWLSFQLK